MKGQMAIEFLSMVGMGIILGIVMLTVANYMTTQKQSEKTSSKITDFASSIQQELILASEVENGYIRKLNLPTTIDGKAYNITIGREGNFTGYLLVDSGPFEVYYIIPIVNGSFAHGNNYIKKINTTLYVTQ